MRRVEEARLFPRWALFLLLTLGLGSLIAAVGLALWTDPRDVVDSYGPDTFSRSSLGHKALVGLLRERGYPVLISRYETAARAKGAGLTMILEPQLTLDAMDARAELVAQLKGARRALLALPKRGGVAASYPEGHIDQVLEVSLADAEAALRAPELWLSVERHDLPSEQARWRCAPELGAAPCQPALYDLQLLRPDPRIKPLIASDEGVLVGEILPASSPDQRWFVLADPDLVANHGLHRGQNAALVEALVAHMRGESDGVVLIDEILHGYLQRPSLIRELGRFPLVLASVQFALIALLALWAGVKRFGPPKPRPAATAADKVFSIKNTAALVHAGRHTAHMTGRYLAMTLEQVAQRLGAPQGLDEAARLKWLAELARARGVRADVEALVARARQLGQRRRARPKEWLDIARGAWRWRRAMLEGAEARDV